MAPRAGRRRGQWGAGGNDPRGLKPESFSYAVVALKRRSSMMVEAFFHRPAKCDPSRDAQEITLLRIVPRSGLLLSRILLRGSWAGRWFRGIGAGALRSRLLRRWLPETRLRWIWTA